RHEADALRGLAVERLAEEQVVLRLREPAEERPHDHGMVAGGHAETRVPVDDPRSGGGDADVGEERDREPRAHRRPVDRRDDRLAAVDDVVDEVARLVEDTQARLPVGRDVLDEAEVSARAEGAVGPAHEHGPRVRVAVDDRPDARELGVRLVADGVQLRRVPQRDAQDRRLGPVELEARKLAVHVAEPTLVLTERDGGVGVVLLNRPRQLNALSGELMDALVAALQELDGDPEIRAIVLGGDERAFAAGADIAELAAATPVSLYESRRSEAWAAIRELRTPLVAAVSGYCLGGGCELAMLCDLGVAPGAGGTQRLTRAVGKAVAMDMILTGRTITAREALAFGLVARVVARESWLDEAKRVAAEIAARGPIAVRLAKEAVDAAFETSLAAGVELERRSFAVARASEDATEGLTAFV